MRRDSTGTEWVIEPADRGYGDLLAAARVADRLRDSGAPAAEWGPFYDCLGELFGALVPAGLEKSRAVAMFPPEAVGRPYAIHLQVAYGSWFCRRVRPGQCPEPLEPPYQPPEPARAPQG